MPSGASPSAERSTGWSLPIELLLQCLLVADTSSRIRASHVCHVWREAALAERRLWDTFSCIEFRDEHHTDVMFVLLQGMLLRSRSLPFDLQIPYRYYAGSDYEYRDRLLGLESFDIQRLVAYRGSALIFLLLNPSRQPLPALLCLDLGRRPHMGVEMDREFGAHSLPNIRRLIAPCFDFALRGRPFLSLRYITTTGVISHRDFFRHCPNLVRLEITDTYAVKPLPTPPPPPTLHTIVVRCERPKALDFVNVMAGWRGIHVRRIIAREIYSLRGVIPLFLESHTQPIELRLTTPDDAVILAALPDDETVSDNSAQPVWTIHPSPPWASDFLGTIENPASNCLTSISVSFARLGALFRAQLNLPGLEKIEICLGTAESADSDSPPVLSGEALVIRAASLRRVAFTFDDRYAHSLAVRLESFQGALVTLRESFRELIQYDAALLDEILVSHQLERECAGFSHLAKQYTVVARGWRPVV